MTVRNQLAVASLILITAVSQVQGQELQSIVVTANRFESKIDTVGSAVTIIEREEIERKRQPTVVELLRSVPGLSVVQSGGRGRTTSVFIRGAESDHTLVLIDGIRANDTTSGLFGFEDLKTENIERIEVIRGPQSVLYGSEAIGGVINIITRKGTKGVNATTTLEGGSHGTHQETLQVSLGNNLVDNATSVSYYSTDGISAALSNNGNSETDAYSNFSISSRTGLNISDDGRTDFTIRYSRGDTELDDFSFDFSPIDALNATQERELISSALHVTKPMTDWLTPTVELGLTEEDFRGEDIDNEFSNFKIDNQTLSVTTKVDIVPFKNNVVTIGYSFEQLKGDNKGNFNEERDVNSFFLQNQFSWQNSIFLTGGLRHDNDSEFGEATTFRVTLAGISENTGSRVHTSFGSGFKAPSFNELFFPGFGNPLLEEETSLGYDVGIEQSFLDDTFVVDVTFFQNNIDDMIGFDTDTFTARNINETTTYGIESSIDAEIFSTLQAALGYTYTKSEDEETGRILARRPRHHATANLYFEPTEHLHTTLTFLLVNSRIDSTGDKMDNYQRVDATVSYDITEHITPYVRVENLFDKDYEEIPGFGTTSFVVFGGVEVTL